MKKAWVMQNLQGRRWLGDQRFGLLMDVVERNDHVALEEMLSQSNKQQKRQYTRALERAILFKSDTYHPCVRILLRYGANASGCDGIGSPYIVLAAEAGCVCILKALVDAGCDVNMRKQDGSSALHKVAYVGTVASAKLLLAKGADIFAKDNLGRTPLHLACALNNTEIVEDMFNLSPEKMESCNTSELCNIPHNSGVFPIYYTISRHNVHLLSLLISKGAQLDIADMYLKTSPLMVAANYGYVDCITVLRDNGADINMCNEVGETALLISAKNNHFEAFKFLLDECQADPTGLDTFMNGPALYLTSEPDILAMLLSKGAPINQQGEDGNYPISVAVESDYEKSVLLLLQYGCELDPDFHSYSDKPKPLQQAIWNGNLCITQLLFTMSVELGYDMTWLEDFLKLPSMVHQQNVGSSQQKTVIRWIKQEMTNVEHQFPRLVTLCRWNIRDVIGDVCLCDKINSLPIPKGLKDFLNFRELEIFMNTEKRE